MLNVLLVLIVPILLGVMASRVARAHQTDGYLAPLVPMLLASFFLRAVMFYVSNNVQLFSHAIGGDWIAYSYYANLVNAVWDRAGFHFVTADELPEMGATSLPPNFYALIAYFNDGEIAREGCAALSALFIGVTALNLFSLCIELGAPPKRATQMTAAALFAPGIVMYSSDMYKDPMVWLLTFGMLAAVLRLLQKPTVRDAVVAVLCCWGLWYVRFYLVFLAAAPLVVGLVGLNTKNPIRTLLVLLGIMAVLIPVLTYTRVFDDLGDRANATFETSSSVDVREGTAMHAGSGVVFDDGGSAFGALPLKILYAVFAPFPWQTGSIAMHLGKIDALLGTYLIWRSIRGAKNLFRRAPSLLMALLTFAAPTIVAYATIMNNIGTTLRQRIPIVLVSMLLASLSWTSEDATDEVDDEDDEDDEARAGELDASPDSANHDPAVHPV